VLAQIEPQTAREQSLFANALVRSLENDVRLQQRNLERDQRLAEAGALSTRAVEADSLAVAQAEASLAEANARQVVAQRALARATVRAPFAGVVSERLVSVGDVVQNGTELFAIVDPSSLRLEAQLPPQSLGGLKVGTPVQALTVPKAAVDLRGVRPSVSQVKNGRMAHTEVVLGMEDMVAELIEVVSGLSVGDTLVLGSSRGIAAGTPIRVQDIAERTTSSTTP
jgi:multidrug resistance efflux pump